MLKHPCPSCHEYGEPMDAKHKQRCRNGRCRVDVFETTTMSDRAAMRNFDRLMEEHYA